MSTVERRRLSDGKLYTPLSLKEKFGKVGAKMWQDAKQFTERRMSGNLSFTAAEMHDYHISAWGEKGWAEQWAAAPPERRRAAIPMHHEFEIFQNYYGEDAMRKWLEADVDKTSQNAGQDL